MIRLAFFGSSDFGLPSLKKITVSAEIELLAVVTQPPRPIGRHHDLVPTPVAEYGTQLGVPVLSFPTLRSPQVHAQLSDLRADVFLVAAYGLLIPEDILELVPGRAVNIHGSLLPRYRGASPIAAAILNGDTKTGVTFMNMTPRLDDGDIITQYELPIGADDTSVTVTQRLARLAAEHIVVDLSLFVAGQITPTTQDPSQVTVTKKVGRDEARAEWRDAEYEVRRIRAYTPWPGSWTTWRGKRLKILAGRAESTIRPEKPGTVVVLDGSAQWGVACERGIFVPTQIQIEGKRPQVASFLVNDQAFVGTVLGS